MTAIQFDEMIAHTWSPPLHAEIRCAAEPFTHLNQEVVPSKNKMHQMGLELWLKKENKNSSWNLWDWTFEVLRLLSVDIGKKISTSTFCANAFIYFLSICIKAKLQNVIILRNWYILNTINLNCKLCSCNRWLETSAFSRVKVKILNMITFKTKVKHAE